MRRNRTTRANFRGKPFSSYGGVCVSGVPPTERGDEFPPATLVGNAKTPVV